MQKTLVVITSGGLHEILSKGEISKNYFNATNYFQNIHLINFSENIEVTKDLIMMCGTENITIHNVQLPTKIGLFSFYYNPLFLKIILYKKIKKLSSSIGTANLVRCFGMSEKAVIAIQLGKYLNVPTILSLHGNPDKDYFRGRRASTLKLKIIGILSLCYEIYVMRNFTHYIGVYNAIKPYFAKFNIDNYSIIYNDVSTSVQSVIPSRLKRQGIKVTNVGRQDAFEKDPKNIILAASKIRNVHLTIIGNGSLHKDIVDLVQKLQIESRVKLIKSLPNQEVLTEISSSDMFVYNSRNSEVSKSCIEAALLGVPVIVNYPENNLSTEIADAGFLQVEDSPNGYELGMKFIIKNLANKEIFTSRTKKFCRANWDSKVINREYLALYKKLNI
jgi:glycosyltransferase involved in cell wall biosynthesis